MDRECSHAECTVLCSPFPSSRHHPEHEHFFNHSRESRAELSGGRVSHCSVCSIASSPPPVATPHSSMSPALHISPLLPFPSPFSVTLLTLSISCPFFPTLTFVLFPHPFTSPCLHHSSCLSVSLCHLFLSPHCTSVPPSPLSLLALDGWRLFVYYRECCSCLIDQPTGRNLRQR